MATCYLQMATKPLAILAMLLAILTFVVAYTVITSIDGLFNDPESLLSRALKIGVKFRLVVSLVSLPFLLPTAAALFVPDVWAGMLAVGLVNGVGQWLLGGGGAMVGPTEGSPPMLAVYATTIIEGLILSLSLLMISFFTLLVLQMKNRKKALEVVLPPEAPDALPVHDIEQNR
ncbi:hypothetical protein [Haloferula rosea]|uniref:Uncharacterized protein n=1 Tax=Haloferula rosea TaxID=490093 RepID=A0A934REW2_9BACT|nr:hypothetical protein [Haloferula rosea]MBK1828373.1 hypothetical protein [Haloferula rosea]